MGRINVLDKHTAELIAAGEVVERPSSVIKELVENSIDAGATSVTVEIKNGGTTFMRVSDNGMGIMRDDIPKAFLRHATSKVATERDLDAIATLGFRGEALASISAVSKVELITRSENEDIGSYYIIEGGEEVSLNDSGTDKGTTIIIRDLFYNIPARQKFLKKDVAEGNAVAQVIDRIALSHPEVSFTFIRDSKQVLKTAGDSKLYSAVYSVFGRDFANSLIDVDYELGGIRVTGYISKPEYARATRSMQTFFVNNRYVRSRTAGAAIDEAAKGSVMVGKFLSCVLNISLPYGIVDVNVHPAKIEVRFVNERPVFDAVYHAVKAALFKGDKRKEAILNTPKSSSDPFLQYEVKSQPKKVPQVFKPTPPVEVKKEPNPIDILDIPVSKPNKTEHHNLNSHTSVVSVPSDKPQRVTPIFERNYNVSDSASVENSIKNLEIIKESQEKRCKEPLHTDDTLVLEKFKEDNITYTISKGSNSNDIAEKTKVPDVTLLEDDEPEFTYIGEVFKTYIIAEINKELLLIDKHALHERIIYNKLRENREEFTQMLLIPESVTLNKTEYTAATENLDMFTECGFEVEDFGGSTLLVRGAPQYICGEDIGDTITEMASYIAQHKRDIRTEKMDWIYHNIACRAAVKAGNTTTRPELISLTKQLLKDDSLKYCPHGRPVSVTLKKSEIEKLFGRT